MPNTRVKTRRSTRRTATKKPSHYQKRLHQRHARQEYVRKVSFTGNVACPFFDEKWCNAAMRYIETGIEALKNEFPSVFRR